jgi:hypothetical protein
MIEPPAPAIDQERGADLDHDAAEIGNLRRAAGHRSGWRRVRDQYLAGRMVEFLLLAPNSRQIQMQKPMAHPTSHSGPNLAHASAYGEPDETPATGRDCRVRPERVQRDCRTRPE